MHLTFGKIRSSLKLSAMIVPGVIARVWCKDIWIITERRDQARDNGYIFFRYLREHHPELRVYYIIDRDASDLKKIVPYGNIIYSESWLHYFCFVCSRIHISAHTGFGCPREAVIIHWLKKILGFKNVFLPHGVSYGIAPFCLEEEAKIDLFLCSGKPEYENVLTNYGYTSAQVAYTGLPRLDEWHHITVNPKQIVLMPTWRMYLSRDPNLTFELTEYFRTYQSLINNGELRQFLEENNLKLVFYSHHEMQKFSRFFSVDCPNIEIVVQDDQYDIQKLLKESALLITDYSSVHFDFAYMDKPVIYYLFDRDEFFTRQYRKTEFDAEKDGFGPVAESEKELIQKLKNSYQAHFQLSDFYYTRMRRFYQLYDEHNCERVFSEITERLT